MSDNIIDDLRQLRLGGHGPVGFGVGYWVLKRLENRVRRLRGEDVPVPPQPKSNIHEPGALGPGEGVLTEFGILDEPLIAPLREEPLIRSWNNI